MSEAIRCVREASKKYALGYSPVMSSPTLLHISHSHDLYHLILIKNVFPDISAWRPSPSLISVNIPEDAISHWQGCQYPLQ